jgi:hypothetical protein
MRQENQLIFQPTRRPGLRPRTPYMMRHLVPRRPAVRDHTRGVSSSCYKQWRKRKPHLQA